MPGPLGWVVLLGVSVGVNPHDQRANKEGPDTLGSEQDQGGQGLAGGSAGRGSFTYIVRAGPSKYTMPPEGVTKPLLSGRVPDVDLKGPDVDLKAPTLISGLDVDVDLKAPARGGAHHRHETSPTRSASLSCDSTISGMLG